MEENYAQYAGIRIEDYKDDINYEQWKDIEKAIAQGIAFRLKRESADYMFRSAAKMMEDFGKGFNPEKSGELLEKLQKLQEQLPSTSREEVAS